MLHEKEAGPAALDFSLTDTGFLRLVTQSMFKVFKFQMTKVMTLI